MSLTEMSKKTRIPVSTIYDRLKLYKDNILKKYTSLIDFSKLGYNTKARVLLKVHKKDKEALKMQLIRCKNVNSIHKVNNGYDFMVEIVFKNVKELENYIDWLEEKFEIKKAQTYYIVDDLKVEGFLEKA